MPMIFCLKCQVRTDTTNVEIVEMGNGRRRMKGKCKICGKEKSEILGN